MHKTKALALVFGLVLLAACNSATPTSALTQPSTQQVATLPTFTPEPISLKVGIQPFASNLPLYIAQQEGYFSEQGLQVEFVSIIPTQDLLTALLLGEVDVSGSAFSTSQFTAISESPGVRFVADKSYLDPDGCGYTAWLARSELLESGELEDLNNLKNVVLAASRSNLYSLYVLDVLLEPVGLTNEDFEIAEIPVENRAEAFRTGALDVATTAEPWIIRIQEAGSAEIWKTWEEILPDAQLATLWYGQSLTQENRDAGNRFMVAYLKAIRQYNEGKTDRNVDLMAEFTQLSPEEARTMCWPAFRSDGSLNFESISEFQQWAVENGFLDSVVPVEGYWDGGFIDYATNVLGE